MFNYLILNNGSHIYDVKNRNGIDIGKIDKEIQLEITNYFNDIAEYIDYVSLNRYYNYKKVNSNNKDYEIKINSIDEIRETIVRMNVVLKDNKEIDLHRKFIADNCKNVDVFEMIDTDNDKSIRWLSINPKETSKFIALEKLCLTLNIKVDEVIFFGDGANDLPIISKVGLGVAMGNALEEVKQQAKEITLSNDEEGIASFLEKI